jgi:NAD(P)-dependent dehydrogenase (short-subunit alcohol dehydrogenase family)
LYRRNDMTRTLDARSTAEDVLNGVSLTNRRIIVTGVSSGAGTEIARALVSHGAFVLGTVRDVQKANDTVADIATAAGSSGGRLELIELDLASLASVRAATDRLTVDCQQFDTVIANAGVMATPFGRTADGFEMQFGTNHLGHFVFINRTASLIRRGGRVVVVSSNGHRGADIDLEDPNYEQNEYDRWEAYNRSKTANSLFAVAFDRRHRGRGVRASAVMPGTGMTPIMRHLSPKEMEDVFGLIAADRNKAGVPALELKSPEQLAATSVWAATIADANEIGGKYLENCRIAHIDDVPGIRDGVMPYAIDPHRAELL